MLSAPPPAGPALAPKNTGCTISENLSFYRIWPHRDQFDENYVSENITWIFVSYITEQGAHKRTCKR